MAWRLGYVETQTLHVHAFFAPRDSLVNDPTACKSRFLPDGLESSHQAWLTDQMTWLPVQYLGDKVEFYLRPLLARAQASRSGTGTIHVDGNLALSQTKLWPGLAEDWWRSAELLFIASD